MQNKLKHKKSKQKINRSGRDNKSLTRLDIVADAECLYLISLHLIDQLVINIPWAQVHPP